MEKSQFKLIKSEKDYIQQFEMMNITSLDDIVEALRKLSINITPDMSDKAKSYAADFANYFMKKYSADKRLMAMIYEKMDGFPSILEEGIRLFGEKRESRIASKFMDLNADQRHDINIIVNHINDLKPPFIVTATGQDAPSANLVINETPTDDEQEAIIRLVLVCYFDNGAIIAKTQNTIEGFYFHNQKVKNMTPAELEKYVSQGLYTGIQYIQQPFIYLG